MITRLCSVIFRTSTCSRSPVPSCSMQPDCARYRLRTPDAIQLATAFAAGATLAITNDEAWRSIAGIETLLLRDFVT